MRGLYRTAAEAVGKFVAKVAGVSRQITRRQWFLIAVLTGQCITFGIVCWNYITVQRMDSAYAAIVDAKISEAYYCGYLDGVTATVKGTPITYKTGVIDPNGNPCTPVRNRAKLKSS